MNAWTQAVRWRRLRHPLIRARDGGSLYCGHGFVANRCPVEVVIRRHETPA